MDEDARKVLLNAGCGTVRNRLPGGLAQPDWRELRLDANAAAKPDLVGSFVDMRGLVADASCDAVFSSHAIEHLHAHEVIPALREFLRVLKPDGFVLIACPDLAAVARVMLQQGAETVIYQSSAGPIRPIDMLFGHSSSIADGNAYMAHNTGFTAQRLARVLFAAGFHEVRIMEGDGYDLWAIATPPQAREAEIAPLFADTQIARLFAPDAVRADKAHLG